MANPKLNKERHINLEGLIITIYSNHNNNFHDIVYTHYTFNYLPLNYSFFLTQMHAHIHTCIATTTVQPAQNTTDGEESV